MAEENNNMENGIVNLPSKKPEIQKYLIMIAAAAVCCLIASASIWLMTDKVMDIKTSIPEFMQDFVGSSHITFPNGNKKEKSTEKEATEETKKSSKKKKETSAEKSTENYFKHTKNKSIDWEELKSLDGYVECNEIKGVTFSYPKTMFNRSSYKKNVASFAYVDSDNNTIASLKVSKKKYDDKKVSHVSDVFNAYKADCNDIVFERNKEEVESDGTVKALLCGHYKSNDSGLYLIVRCDDEYEYIMEYIYPDSDPKNNYSVESYSYDCLYRMCSFSGSTYKPRSFNSFKKDDMGEKK